MSAEILLTERVDTHQAIVVLKDEIRETESMTNWSVPIESHFYRERIASCERAIELLTRFLPPNFPEA